MSAAENEDALRKTLGQRLERLIYQRYKSKDDFLRASGFYKANLHSILKGRTDPQLSTLQRLAQALNIPLSELLKE